MSSDGWGKEIEKIFNEKCSQYDGYRILWNGQKTSSIKIEKINEEKELQEKNEKNYFEKIKEKETIKQNKFKINNKDYGLSL